MISSETVNFTICPRFKSDFSCEVDALVLPRVSAYSPPVVNGLLQLDYLEGLELADPNCMNKGHIDLLLGASVHARIIEGRVIKGNFNEPIATSSWLGWLILGDISAAIPDLSYQITVMNSIEEPPLHNLLQKFWQIEEVPSSSHYIAEEQACEMHFVETHFRDESGRYIVRLPFKDPSRFSSECFDDS